VDPFCENCLDGVYDSNATRVVRVNLKKFVNITTNAQGIAVTQVVPAWTGSLRSANAITSGVVGGWDAAVALPYYDTANFASYRVISVGYRFISSVSPMTASGVVVGTVSDSIVTAYDTTAPQLYKDWHEQRLFQAVTTWVGRPVGVNAQAFIPMAGTSDGWEVGYITIVGAPASTLVGRLEMVLNVEALPKVNYTSIASVLTVQAKPSVPMIRDAAGKVQSTMKPFKDESDGETATESIMHMVEGVVCNMITTYGPTALEAVIGLMI
jgi:hypothetical protein